MTDAKIPIQWRVLAPDSGDDFEVLVDRAFGLTAPESYLADFPVWDPEIAPASNRHQIGGFIGPRLACTASIRFADYRFVDGTASSLGLIGAVATDPDFVRRGYASEAIGILIQEGDRRGVGAFALWGSDSPLYRSRGFEFGGRQLRVSLRALEFPRISIPGFELRSGWDSAIAEHLFARKSGLQYGERDIDWLSRHSNVEWLRIEVDGKCLAYVGWNRGIDLPNIVHEIGGEAGPCLALLGALRERHSDLEWIAHPELLSSWKIKGSERGAVETLAQFRLRSLSSEKTDEIWLSGMDSC